MKLSLVTILYVFLTFITAFPIEKDRTKYYEFNQQTAYYYRTSELNYRSQIHGFLFGKGGYVFSSEDTLVHKKFSYAPQKALDADLKTAWCSNKEHPKVTLSLNTTPEACYLVGISLINGYTKSPKIWSANRQIKSGTIRFGNLEARPFSFTKPDFKNGFDPYQTIQYIDRFDKSAAKYLQEDYDFHNLRTNKVIKITIKINEFYSGNKYKDVCISEIYPLYKCSR